MANQRPDAETARDLEALPVDLQPLYRRLTDDGAAWQAASAARFALLARTLVADVERIASDGAIDVQADDADDTPAATPIALPAGAHIALPAHSHKREWIFGTLAAVAVVALLALVLQGALAGRGSTGPANKSTGHWQILDKLTWKRASSGQVLPSIAPTNPQVVYEATNLVNGAAETSKAVSYASLRRTEDGGESWQNLPLPLPIVDVSTVVVRVSPLNAQTVFLSIWDRSTTACEPTNGIAGEGCERGYVSYDGGDSWRAQTLPVRGVLDTSGSIVAQDSRLYATNVCNDDSCVHLLTSFDGGVTWHAMDAQITASKQHVCDLAAPTSGRTVYAVASQFVCTQLPSSKTLWRSDDASATWTQVGPLLPKSGAAQSFTLLSDPLLTAPGRNYSALLYLSQPYVTAHTGTSFQYSEDGGVTWKSTPEVPNIPSNAYDAVQPLPIGEATVLSDGSLLYFPFATPGTRMTPYVWTPGDSAWQRLPQLPAEVTGPGSITVTPGASGHDTLTMALRANGDASNPIAYYVVRYQM